MYSDKKDFENIAASFFVEQGLEIKNKAEKTNINFAMIGEFIWQDENLAKNDIRVILFLSNMCRDKGYTWVSQDTIARELNICLKQVNRIIRKLEDEKYIRTRMIKQSNNRYNNITVLTYSPYLKSQYKTSLDKSKPAQKSPAGGVGKVQQGGLETSHDKERLQIKNNSTSLDNTILSNSDIKPSKQIKFEAYELDINKLLKDFDNYIDYLTDNTDMNSKDEEKLYFLHTFNEYYPEVKIRKTDLKELKEIDITSFVYNNIRYWRYFIATTDDSYLKSNGSLDLLLLLRNQSKFKKHIEQKLLFDELLRIHHNTRFFDDWFIDGLNKITEEDNISWKFKDYKEYDLKYLIPYNNKTNSGSTQFEEYDSLKKLYRLISEDYFKDKTKEYDEENISILLKNIKSAYKNDWRLK